jgi:hypothetical protein
MLWMTMQNPHPSVDNSGEPSTTCGLVWTTVDNQRTTPTVPTRENSGFPQVHNPYNYNEKNNASL